MTGDEWVEICEWVNTRYSRGWALNQSAAFGADLKDHQTEDVWDAVYRIHDRGGKYPPDGGELGAEVVSVARDRARRERDAKQGLPEATGDLSWSTWSKRLGFGTLNEAIKASHETRFPHGCPYPDCDVHVVDIPSSVV